MDDADDLLYCHGVVHETVQGLLTPAYLVAFLAIVFTAYTYTSNSIHPKAGFLVGWALLLDYIFSPIIAILTIGIFMNAEFPYKTKTSPNDRLYQLATKPAKPGLVRVLDGVAIEVEVWDMPVSQLGVFMKQNPAPLGIGKVMLANGEEVLGFICEPAALEQATDISYTGGWRYLETSSIN